MPDWRAEIGRRLEGLALEPARETEIVEELAQHLEDRYRELQAAGAGEADAARAALLEISEGGRLAHELRRVERRAVAEPVVLGAGRTNLPGDLWQDLRYGLRLLIQQPVFAGAAVLALALGIGGNTAIFSLVNTILLRQLPFRQPDEVVWITSRRAEPGRFAFTVPDFIDFRDQNQSLSGIAAFATWSANLTGSGDPERLQGLRFSASAFEMLGVAAEVGRTLRPEDDTPGQQRVVVLSHGLWRRRFGGDPGIVGTTLTLNGAG